eukprot:GILJ01005563.1.p1 GENE.GILJ01005563.1~~GILJ01005563.1.p1  ORF type:complete len:842 (-),score=67.21 GILJ01005563.1:1417-3885(-)
MKRRKKRTREDEQLQNSGDKEDIGREKKKKKIKTKTSNEDEQDEEAGQANQKQGSVHVVKCKVGRGRQRDTPDIWQRIEELVKITSQVVYQASHLANLFVLYSLDNGQNPFDNGTQIQSWFVHWMRIVLDRQDMNIDPSWVDFLQRFDLQCPLVGNQVTVQEKHVKSKTKRGQPSPSSSYVAVTKPWEPIDLGNVLYSMSRDLKTNFENSLFIPFNQRLKSTLKAQLRAHGIELHSSCLNHLRSYIRRHVVLFKNRVTFKKINGITYTKNQQGNIDPVVFTSSWEILTKVLDRHVDALQNHPGLRHRDGLRDCDLKRYPYWTIRYLFYLQKTRQRLNVSNFTLLPVRKMKRHFIEVDTRLLYNMYNRFYPETLDDYNLTNETQFTEQKEIFWNSLLDVRQFRSSKKKFAYTSIRTDGVQICVPLCSSTVGIVPENVDPNSQSTKRRKLGHSPPDLYKTTLKQACKQLVKEHRLKSTVANVTGNENGELIPVIGIDEGRGVLLATYNNQDHTSHTLTNHQYRKYSGITQRIKRYEDWMKGNSSLKAAMDLVSLQQYKTADWRQYLAFLRVQWTVYDILWNSAVAPRHSNDDFRVYRLRSACVDNFLHHVFDDHPNAAVAYGDATFNSSGKGQLSAPTSWLSKRAQLFFTQQNRRRGYNNVVVEVDEYNTSKFCHKCHCRLEKSDKSERCRLAMSDRFRAWGLTRVGDPVEDKLRRSLCWRFSWCGTPGCEKLRHRDKNAAANMASLLTGYFGTLNSRSYRSPVFCRPSSSSSSSCSCSSRGIVSESVSDPLTSSPSSDPSSLSSSTSSRWSGLRLVNLRPLAM